MHSREGPRTVRIRLYGVVDDISSPVRRITHALVGDAPGAIFGADRRQTCCPRDQVEASADVVSGQYPERVVIKSGNTARHDNVLTRIDLGALRWGNKFDLRYVTRYWYATAVSGCGTRQ